MSILKKIFVAVLSLLLIGLMVGGVFAIYHATQKEEVCEEHTFVDGVCENCGKSESEVSWTLDIVTKDCNIKFFVGEEKKEESFGVGINGYTIGGLYDNLTVVASSVLSDETKINVYKCTYSDNGEYTGYAVDAENILFGEKKYDKELLTTLSVTSPILEITSEKDCLYIFEKI